MKPAWIGFAVFVAIMVMLLGSVPVGADIFSDEEVTGPLQTLMSYTETWQEGSWTTIVNPLTHISFFSDFLTTLLFENTLTTMFSGPYLIIYWLIWGPVIAIVVFGLAMLFVGIIQRTISI